MHNRIRPVRLGIADGDRRTAGRAEPVAAPAGRAVDRRAPGGLVDADRRARRAVADRRHRAGPDRPCSARRGARRLRLAAAVPAQGAGRGGTAVAAGASVGRAGRPGLRPGGGRRAAAVLAAAQLPRQLAQARADLRADRVRRAVRIPRAVDDGAAAARAGGAAARSLPRPAVRPARRRRHAGAVLLDHHHPAGHPRTRCCPRCSPRASTRCATGGEFTTEYRTALELGRAVPGRPRGARRPCC